MFSDTMANTIASKIEKEIYQDFEAFIKDKQVSKNWFRTIHPKTILGKLSINIPRTRWNKKDGTTYIPDLSKLSLSEIVNQLFIFIINLFSTWNTFQDIRFVFQNTFGFGIGNDLLSRIYNSIFDTFIEWKNKPLNEFYIALYLDAMYIKLKVDDSIKSVPVYFIIWINSEWKKEVLDFVIWLEAENSKAWLNILNQLKSRWLKEVIFAIFDWLPGLSKSAKIAFPKAKTQRCVLHKVRNTIQLIKSTDEKEFLSDLKKIYKAPSKEEAIRLLNEFKKKWSKYRAILEDWLYSMDEWWEYYNYSPAIRKLIYTTNIIESFNSLIRRHMWKKRVFFTEKSATIAIYLAVVYNKDRLKPIHWIRELRLELFTSFPEYKKYLTW